MNHAENKQAHSDIFNRTVRDAGNIGRVWARYGLTAGKNALSTSAVTLEKVANLLNDLATNMKRDEDTIDAKGEVVQETIESPEFAKKVDAEPKEAREHDA